MLHLMYSLPRLVLHSSSPMRQFDKRCHLFSIYKLFTSLSGSRTLLLQSEMSKNLINSMGLQVTGFGLSIPYKRMSMKLLIPKPEGISKYRMSLRPTSWLQGGSAAGLIFGVLVCYSTSLSKPAFAKVSMKKTDDDDKGLLSTSHGKVVYTDYTITGIPGDGRCLFRSVAHGACIRSGNPNPSESRQRELADELRNKVADEFIKRRAETEWFVEGDFDMYVSQIRNPYVWGGEPELFMASHVLKMPITVYMHDVNSGGLIAIAEYGQEYGKENPIRVLYHGSGHYDSLQIHETQGGRSRL